MKLAKALAMATSLVGLAGTQATAGIVILERSSTLQVVAGQAGGEVSDGASSTSPAGDFNQSRTVGSAFTPPALGALATASQASGAALNAVSLIVGAEGNASGQARGTPGSTGPNPMPGQPAQAIAQSLFTLRFAVTGGAETYSFSGKLFATQTLPGNNGIAGASVRLRDAFNENTVYETFASNPTTGTELTFNETGSLPVGEYLLTLNANRIVTPTQGGPAGQGGRSYETYFDDVALVVTATAVPEPSTLGALALLGVVARRRR